MSGATGRANRSANFLMGGANRSANIYDDGPRAKKFLGQLPDALVEQFHTAVTRAGRARKKSRRQVDADKQVFYMQ